MKSNRLIALALAALAWSACDSVDQVVTPRSNDFNVDAKAVVVSTVQQQLGAYSYVVIGPEGGTLTSGPHTLTVLPGSVTAPTIFAMKVVGGNTVHVELHAYQGDGWAEIHTFAGPVQLALSYRDAAAAPTSLSIAYLVDGTEGGAKELIGSWTDTATNTIRANLPHFSDYVLATN